MNIPTLQDVKKAHPTYFADGNMEFFGDLGYDIITTRDNKGWYFLQHTNAWTDMFDGVKKPHYRIRAINSDLSFEPMLSECFASVAEVIEHIN